MICLW